MYFKGFGINLQWFVSRYYLVIRLDELKKTTQILSQKALGCKPESVTLDSACSVTSEKC
jgi:hypothetical protein